jgi:Fanconi anemia group M protein
MPLFDTKKILAEKRISYSSDFRGAQKTEFFDIFQKESKEEENKPKPVIVADIHEKNSLVISELFSLGIQVDFRNLPVADFLIRDIAIERKTISDFISSMINKRLSRQLEEMKQYPKQLLIIEGIEEKSLYEDNKEGVNANAVRGFLLNILLEYQVPIIFTKNYEDTAKFLLVLAKKELKEHESIRAKKKSLNKKEQLQYILEGFPGIGPANAKKLLEKFGTIKNIVNASDEELRKEIGKKAEIFKLLEERY